MVGGGDDDKPGEEMALLGRLGEFSLLSLHLCLRPLKSSRYGLLGEREFYPVLSDSTPERGGVCGEEGGWGSWWIELPVPLNPPHRPAKHTHFSHLTGGWKAVASRVPVGLERFSSFFFILGF